MLKLNDSAAPKGRKNLVVDFINNGFVYEVFRTPVTDQANSLEEAAENKDIPIKGVGLKTWIREVDKAVLTTVLEKVNWNKSKTARLLGLTRTALIQKCKRYNISKKDK